MRYVVFAVALMASLATFAPPISAQSGWDLIRLMRLNAEGNRAFLAGDYPRAIQSFEEAHEISQGPRLRNDPLAVTAKANLGSVYETVGRFPEALELLRDAYSTSKTRLGANDPKRLQIANNLGSLYVTMGRYSEAEPIYLEVLEERTQRFGADDAATLLSTGNMARLYRVMGRLRKAETFALQALRGRERVLGKAHEHTLFSLTNLATIYLDMGRLAEANALFVQAMPLADQLRGPDHPETIIDRGNLALLYHRLGRLDEAEDLYLQTIGESQRVFGSTHPDTLSAQNNLAGFYYDTGRVEDAVEIFEKVLWTTNIQFGAESPDTLNSRNNLALAYLALRRFDEAETLLDETIATGRQSLSETHPIVLAGIRNLAGLREFTGDLDRAEDLYLEATAALSQVFGNEHPTTLAAVVDYAALLVERDADGDADRLEQLLNPALDHWVSYVDTELSAGAGDAQRATLGGRIAMRDVAVSAALQSLENIDLGARAILMTKGVAGERDAALSRLVATDPRPSVRQTADALRLAESELHASYQTQDPDRVRAALQRRDGLRRALFARFGPSNEASPFMLRPNAIMPKRVTESLADSEIFLDYAIYDPQGDGLSERAREPRIVLCAYRPGAAPQVFDLGPAAAITEAILKTTDYKTNREESLFGAQWMLRNVLLDPVQDLLSEAETVIVSPDGILARVNYSLLQDPEDTNRHLVERVEVRVVPNGRVLFSPSGDAPEPDAAFLGAGLNDFGPFNAETCTRGPRGTDAHGLCPLEMPVAEVSAISDLFDAANLPSRRPLLNDGATEAAVTAAMPGTRYIHIATHGGEQLAGSEGVGLHNVGLAFHGIGTRQNRNRIVTAEDDGILSGYEAARLRLWGTELVNMSACDTALGEAAGTEGIWSMAYAFRLAGAESVLMTLWSIDDAKAPNFMAEFYRNLIALRKEAASAEAPREAIRAALRATVLWAIENEWNYWEYGPYVLVES